MGGFALSLGKQVNEGFTVRDQGPSSDCKLCGLGDLINPASCRIIDESSLAV